MSEKDNLIPEDENRDGPASANEAADSASEEHELTSPDPEGNGSPDIGPEPDPEKEPIGDSLHEEVEKWRDVAARSQADLENYRKRMSREKTEAMRYANADLLRSLLSVIDNFEMGLKAARDQGEESVIYQGMVMVHKQLRDFLSENRVETIEAGPGAPFDPTVHEAIQQEYSDEIAEGQVIATLRNGYRLHDRLLRPANVVVSRGASVPETEGAGAES